MYEAHLAQLDAELKEICDAFHADDEIEAFAALTLHVGDKVPHSHGSSNTNRQARLHVLAKEKQKSVTRILTLILNDKKNSLPYLLEKEDQERPPNLHVAVLDHSAEGLSLAAHLANKPFKQAVRMLAAELKIPAERILFGRVKSLSGISGKQQRGGRGATISSTLASTSFSTNSNPAGKAASTIFDLNRATIVFESERELQDILAALPRFFHSIVSLDNKFKKQWDEATQPPCLHLNLWLKPESLPSELVALLSAGGLWVVELQLSMKDFLDVKQRCHAIYEILRLRPTRTKEEHNGDAGQEEMKGQPPLIPLPRACPVCGLLQHNVKSSQLTTLEFVSFHQKLVNKCLLDGKEVAYNLIAVNDDCTDLEPFFVREVSLLTRLDHPNVLQITGVVRESRALGFVTEWMPHGTLWGCLHDKEQRRGLDVWDVSFQLCDALVYVHSHGVVHFDLKSKNVLLARVATAPSTAAGEQIRAEEDEKGRGEKFQDQQGKLVVKLCDFGLSRDMDSTLHTAVKVGGTPNWQAPESWSEVNSTHPSADVYAFGCMLIELFGQTEDGSPCFPWMALSKSRDKSKKLIKQQVVQSQAKPPELGLVADPTILQLATDCLAFDPKLRPTMKKVRARLVAAHFDSQAFDPNARQLFKAMDAGQVSFSELFTKLQASNNKKNPHLWSATLSFLQRYSKVSPRFEVALAMCRHFTCDNRSQSAATSQADMDLPCSVTKADVGSPCSIATLFEVCERHMNDLVVARFMAGWCCEFGGTTNDKTIHDKERAVMYYRQAAAQGYPAAQFHLGMCHKTGKGEEEEAAIDNGEATIEAVRWFEKTFHLGMCLKTTGPSKEETEIAIDNGEAVRWFEKAAKQGHIGARLNLVKCYQLGEGVDLDWSIGEHWLEQAYAAHCVERLNDRKKVEGAELAGVSQIKPLPLELLTSQEGKMTQNAAVSKTTKQLFKAYVWAEECFEQGKEVEKDTVEAARLHLVAANFANAHAVCMLGRHSAKRKDYQEAVRLFRFAVHLGNADAQFDLGVCYFNGKGVTQDYQEAARLFRLAADQGDATAQFNLGVCYDDGKGVTQDYQEAVRLFRLAADQGNATAQLKLGVCYFDGRGVTQDSQEAARLFKLAADQGDANAQFNLGVCYAYGRGVTQDDQEAVRLFRLAADQGDAAAQRNLGVCYANGRGVQQDYQAAVRLCKLAADQGDADAQSHLGWCYASGRGVTQDYQEAARLFRLAADQGNATAQLKLGVCYELGRGVTQDYQETVRLYRLAADQGDADAQRNIGWCYELGRGVQQDAQEAVALYKLAADQGNAPAQFNLALCYASGIGVQQDEQEAARLYRLSMDNRL